MGKYVDGFVLPLPKDRIDEYRAMARTAGEVWREHGALAYVECIAEDVKPGKVTSFPQAVRLKDNETVIFSWIVHASRSARDKTNELAMKDPRLAEFEAETMPFDAMRMFWGGFDVLLEV